MSGYTTIFDSATEEEAHAFSYEEVVRAALLYSVNTRSYNDLLENVEFLQKVQFRYEGMNEKETVHKFCKGHNITGYGYVTYPPTWEVLISVIKAKDTETYPSLIRYMDYADKIKDLKRDGKGLEWLENPDEFLQYVGVSQNGDAIQTIKRPKLFIQLVAVSNFGQSIRHISHPSPEVQMAAVRNDPWALEYIKNPTEKVKAIAIHKDPFCARFLYPRRLMVEQSVYDESARTYEYKYHEFFGNESE